MQTVPRHRRATRGFTLLELLVATAVSATVLLVINATFFSALRLHNTTHERIDRDLVLQRTLGIVRKDFAGVMLPGGTLAGQLQTTTFSSTTMDSAGERIGPDIYTNSARIDGWTSFSEVQMVAYYLSPAADGGPTKDLVRVVTRNLLPVQEPTTQEQVLLPGIVTATISFYDGSDWIDDWDSTVSNTLPRAIKLSMVLSPSGESLRASDPIELIVPVLVKTRTTVQEEAAAAAESGT